MLIFVAHDFRNLPFADYRSSFSDVEIERSVDFVFADDLRSADHLLSEIEMQIKNADLCLFDVTTWNPNVLLELGLARGYGRPHLLLIRPTVPRGFFRRQPSNLGRVPSDVAGLRREQYADAASLRRKLNDIVTEFKEGADLSHTANILFDRVQGLLARHPDGLTTWEIASQLKLDSAVTSAVVKGLVGDGKLGKSGRGTGTRYHPPGEGELQAAS